MQFFKHFSQKRHIKLLKLCYQLHLLVFVVPGNDVDHLLSVCLHPSEFFMHKVENNHILVL